MINIKDGSPEYIIFMFNGGRLIVSQEYDDGDPIRKHKKKRIAKKWRKRYGVRREPLKRDTVVRSWADGAPAFYMSRRTYCIIKQHIRGTHHPK